MAENNQINVSNNVSSSEKQKEPPKPDKDYEVLMAKNIETRFLIKN